MNQVFEDALEGYTTVMGFQPGVIAEAAVRQAVVNAFVRYLYDACDEFQQWATAPGVNGEPVTRETKKTQYHAVYNQMPKWKGGEVYERLSRF